MPSIDVVVPCYNYGRFLSGCVESVLAQGIADVRLLIIDDCSKDDSLAIAREIAAREPRVTVMAHAVNKGHIATYNEGIDWACSDYFLLLSADDLVAPGAFRRAIAVMERLPSVSMTHGDDFCLRPNAPMPLLPDRGGEGEWHVAGGAQLVDELCRTACNRIRTSTVIVRTSAQTAAGHYRADLPHTGDLEMWLRLAALGDVAETQSIQGIRRMHGDNMSSTVFARASRDWFQRAAAYESFFRNGGIGLEHGRRMRWRVRTVLAREFVRLGLAKMAYKLRTLGRTPAGRAVT